MNRSNNLNPKLLISDYCDSVIREIDIEIEQRLEKCSRYIFNEQDKCDRLNRDREEMIGKVKEIEIELFEYYETIRKDENIKELPTDKNALESKLFANKSILFIARPNLANLKVKYYLLIFDFYLSQAQKDLLK